MLLLSVTIECHSKHPAHPELTLLRTQDDDGSWFVNKRAIPVNNYLDTGFPHGASQHISYTGTCWATMALILAAADTPRSAGTVASR